MRLETQFLIQGIEIALKFQEHVLDELSRDRNLSFTQARANDMLIEATKTLIAETRTACKETILELYSEHDSDPAPIKAPKIPYEGV